MTRHRITGTAIALALVALFAFVPSASAVNGVRGYLELEEITPFPETAGGTITLFNGFDVRDSGASADAGDLYLLGLRETAKTGGKPTSGGFVTQLSPGGQIRRTWGAGVVAAGSPGNADETQAVRVSATAGSFTLSFGGDTTAVLDFDAGGSTVEAALNALPSIAFGGGSVTVSGGPGDAAGSAPYLVSFDGGPLNGADQPLLGVDGSGLAGLATVYTTNPGDSGFEVCEPAAGDACKSPVERGGAGPAPSENRPGGLGPGVSASVAIDQVSGDVYTGSALHRVNRYSAHGQFLGSFGYDVVRQGPDDSNVDAAQWLSVGAASGSYTLTLFVPQQGPQTTGPIAVGASAGAVKTAIDALPALKDSGGSVSVSGPDGGPYTIVFDGGSAGGDQWGELAPSASAAVTTLQNGGAIEVCKPDDACKYGGQGRVGAFDQQVLVGLAVAPADAPNQGNVLVEASNGVAEYSPDGQLVRFFAAGAVDDGAAGTGDLSAGSPIVTSVSTTSRAFAVGQQISGAGIPAGTTIGDLGAGTLTLSRPATASGSAVALSAPAGPDNVANDEQQTLAISPETSGGSFKLTFSTPDPSASSQQTAAIPYNAPAGGPGSVQEALESLSNVDPGDLSVSGAGGPGGAFTVAFGGRFADTDVNQLSTDSSALIGTQSITVVRTGKTGTFSFFFKSKQTGGIPYTASAAVVQNALAALSTIGPGNVSVSGPAGGPWTVSFTGALAGSPQPTLQVIAAEGGLMTVTAPDATATTTQQGASAFEVCKTGSGDLCREGATGAALGQFGTGGGNPSSIAESPSGAIYTVERKEGGAGTGPLLGNGRVQMFTPAGGLDLTPSVVGADESQQLSVNAAAGQFRLTAVAPNGTSGRVDMTAGSPVLTNLRIDKGVFQVGQRIEDRDGQDRFPLGTTILAIGSGTLTVSAPANPGSPTSTNVVIDADRLYTTSDLPFDSTAATVEAAINDLAPLKDVGASVSVSGPAGGPWTIAYDDGSAPRHDFAPLGTEAGTLTGGSGPGANQAVLNTLADGGPDARTGFGESPRGVAVTPGGDLLVAKQFPQGSSLCPPGLPAADSFPPTFKSFSLASNSSPEEFRLQQWSADGLSLASTSVPCTIDPSRDLNRTRVIDGVRTDGLRVDPGSGEAYMFDGEAGREDRLYVYGEVGSTPQLNLEPVGGIGSSDVMLSGTIDPNGPGPIDHPNPSVTRYAVEYRKVGDPDWTRYVSAVPVGSGFSPVPFSIGIGGLAPKTDYEARVLAVKPFGFAPQIQTTAQFTTLAGKPKVASPYADTVTVDSADLHGLVTPNGADTTYRFEYGTTTAYGHSTPAVGIGAGNVAVTVSAHVEGLEPVVQHFRLVATNSEGTDTGADQTFSFYPEPCPNAAARQQTGSELLPDCRAYEMVSPDGLGSTVLRAEGPFSPLATSPPRLAFTGTFGALPGPWNPPNSPIGGNDNYVATRTDSGWRTSYVGLEAQDVFILQGNPSKGGITLAGDLGLDRFIQWGLSPSGSGESSAPFLFDVEGRKLGRLPSNFDQVPGAELDVKSGGFYGDQQLSGDGRHFVFSSANLAFAPGGLTSGAGSVYDEDLASGEVKLISKTEGGGDIPQQPGQANAGHALSLPGVSVDGSHVLIGSPSACSSSEVRLLCLKSPAVLYMAVNGTTHYDVSEGHPVAFEGMGRDGSVVFFTSAEQITADDHDASTDVFKWSEASDAITRVSAGSAPVGDTDACNASWIAACGAPAAPHDSLAGLVSNPVSQENTDNAVSADGKSIYFYSPEQLVGSEGFPGRRNLYAYRDGAVHFVAALDAERPATRIQVSADGRYAAFVTESRLTGYDNQGFAEMYRYDDAGGELVCVSCNPTGTPPAHDVKASLNGIFLSDDGRAFFTTEDPLVARDADGLPDVYEFSEGRAQLITTGVAAQGDPHTGLLGVSADGSDAYFTTLETLVPQDHNGPFLKIYDARVNGGFPVPAQILPCAAADECHGADNAAPGPPPVASGASLGAAGNVTPPRKACRRGKVRRHGRCVKRRRGRHRAQKRSHREADRAGAEQGSGR